MCSDFIGDCALFIGLPELISETDFLTPRMTRDQYRDAIVEPARVFGWDLEPDLVNRLLNDLGDTPDQLPVLQHGLDADVDAGRRRFQGGKALNAG
jgi:hypothetical protein